jgi:hypothetical protein
MVDRAGVPSLTMLDGVAHVEYVVCFTAGSRGCRASVCADQEATLFFQLPIFLVRFRVGACPPPPSVCACALQKPSG